MSAPRNLPIGGWLVPAVTKSSTRQIAADTPMVSENLVPVTTVEDAKKIMRIMDAIEDNDDVQDVYSNFDIPDDIMEAAAG